eukprot:6124897-Prymnesium_polylepis.1
MHDSVMTSANVRKVEGALIEVLVDADRGLLAFRVNGGLLLQALAGFPRGSPLRPWASLKYDTEWEEGDCVTLSSWRVLEKSRIVVGRGGQSVRQWVKS